MKITRIIEINLNLESAPYKSIMTRSCIAIFKRASLKECVFFVAVDDYSKLQFFFALFCFVSHFLNINNIRQMNEIYVKRDDIVPVVP